MRQFATMRDVVTRQARAMMSAVEEVARDVATVRTEMREMKSAVENVEGEVESMKTGLRDFIESLDGRSSDSGAANIEGAQTNVDTIKSDVEMIKTNIGTMLGQHVAQTVEAVQGDVQTIKGDVGKVMIDSQVSRQTLRELQEEMATVKSVLAIGEEATTVAGAGRAQTPLTPQMEQSVTQTVESVQQVQGELQTVTQAVQSVRGDVETIKQAVDAIRETLRAPSRRSPNGIMRTSSSMSSLQLPAVHPQNR